MKRKKHSMGTMQLALISAAAAGCSPVPDEPVYMSRGIYDSITRCVQDWQDVDQCEPFTDVSGSYGGSSSGGSSGTSPRIRPGPQVAWQGPYYAPNGRAYLYDGRSVLVTTPPSNAVETQTLKMTVRDVYNTSGRYASTVPHPQALPAKTLAMADGGFGGTGRSLFGGGGG